MASRMGDAYPPGVLPGVASVLNDPELSEVIRPTPTGIPEFDLSRIIPSEKPSSTLQYFPILNLVTHSLDLQGMRELLQSSSLGKQG